MKWILFLIVLNPDGIWVTQQLSYHATESLCVEAAANRQFICMEVE